MIAVEDLLRTDQVMSVAAGLVPGKSEKRLNVASENSALRRLARKILEAFDFLIQLILDFLRRLEFLSGLPEVVDIAQRCILAELLTDHFELLSQQIFLLVLVDTLSDFFLQFLADRHDFGLIGEKNAESFILLLHRYGFEDDLSPLIGQRHVDSDLAEHVLKIIRLHNLHCDIPAYIVILGKV